MWRCSAVRPACRFRTTGARKDFGSNREIGSTRNFLSYYGSLVEATVEEAHSG